MLNPRKLKRNDVVIERLNRGYADGGKKARDILEKKV